MRTSIPGAELITMLNGKTVLLFDGYTFYKRQTLKRFNKWNCTVYPKCDAYVNIDNEMNVWGSKTTHNHKARQVIRTSSGRYTRL